MARRLDVKEEGYREFPIPKDGKSLYINYGWCKGCSICIEFCPKDVFDYSVLGQPVVARPEACTLCMICVHRCPDFSIVIEASGQIVRERREKPIVVHMDKGGREDWWTL